MKQRNGKEIEITDLPQSKMLQKTERKLSEIATAKYKLTRWGNALRLDDTFRQWRSAEVSFEDSLLERFWDLHTQLPEKAFSLTMKAFDNQTDLYFLLIEGTSHGVYLKGQDFADGLKLFGFDRLAVQLPDAPVLGFTGGFISGIILPGGSPVIGNFVEWAEASKHGDWILLDDASFLPDGLQIAEAVGSLAT